MSISALLAILQAALSLLMLVQAHPELPQSVRDNAEMVAQNAITTATASLGSKQVPPTTPVPVGTASSVNFMAQPSGGTVPLTVNFKAQHVKSGTSGALYFVRYGDGSEEYMNGNCNWYCAPDDANSTHTYTTAGTYYPTLYFEQCSPGGACTGMRDPIGTLSITVSRSGEQSPVPPGISAFTATPSSGAAPLVVTFAARSTYPKDNHYSINFGDGLQGTMNASCWENPSCTETRLSSDHAYKQAGSYHVLLYMTPACPSGQFCSDTVELVGDTMVTVTDVYNTPRSSLNLNKAMYLPGEPMIITWQTTNGVHQKDWIGIAKENEGWTSAFGGENQGWFWTSGSSAGDKTLSAPRTAGAYQLVFYSSNTGNLSDSTINARSSTFYVGYTIN